MGEERGRQASRFCEAARLAKIIGQLYDVYGIEVSGDIKLLFGKLIKLSV
jgi:hypothetical protein